MTSHSSILLIVGISITLSACSLGPQKIAPPMNIEARSQVLGVWDWEGEDACQENTHTVSFEDGGDALVLTFQQPLTPDAEHGRTVYRYQIVGGRGNSITGVMEDEHRMTDSGDPVVWTLTMFTPNEYRWQRSDWETNRYTRAVVRCAGEAPSSALEQTDR